jgi:hypothetical protein
LHKIVDEYFDDGCNVAAGISGNSSLGNWQCDGQNLLAILAISGKSKPQNNVK